MYFLLCKTFLMELDWAGVCALKLERERCEVRPASLPAKTSTYELLAPFQDAAGPS